MMTDTAGQRYLRFGGIGRLYGEAALDRFSQAHVCLVGIGGVGSWTVEALARSGIGKMTLVDLDDVCESNINSQIHALDGTIGSSKIETMAQRCRAINPSGTVHTKHAFLSEKNADEQLSGDLDFVVDAIDSAKHKAAMIIAARRRGVPILTVGGAGGCADPSQVQLADLSRSFNDPLLQRVRKILRQEHGFPRDKKRKFKIPCVFTPEDKKHPEFCDADEEEPKSIRLDCESGFGAVTHLTGTFGFFAASAVLKHLAAESQR